MSDSRILRLAGLFAVAGVLSGCYALVYRGQDDKSLRRAEDYSEASMRWHALPVPSWTETRLRHWPSLPEVRRIERGRVYCSSITIVRGDEIEHADGGHHDSWRYLGRSCAEVEQLGASSVVTIFGVIDFDTRRLHTHIGFSG